MSLTSANINDLATFIDGTTNRVAPIKTTRSSVRSKATSVTAACTFQHPSTNSLTSALQLLNAWEENARFVKQVRDDLVEADNADADGNATVSNATVAASLASAGLTDPPSIVEVPAIVLYGDPPYSGFVDDPISLANGNFLLRDGDLPLFGIAAALSVVRTYNSRDDHEGAFGRGWSSLLDVSLAVTDRRLTFRGPDGGGAEFRRLTDGGWTADDRRGLTVDERVDGWTVRERHDRTWTFDRAGALVAFTVGPADVVVERRVDAVTFTERRSGRWITFHLDVSSGLARSIESSDGRTVDYTFADGRLVTVRRDVGDVTYVHDAAGFVAEVTDADGITVCRNTYDQGGRVVTQVEEHGRETSYEYRTDGVSVVSASDGAPANVMVHDRRGRMTAMIDGLGHVMRVAYDDRDEITQLVDRTGALTRLRHDDRGNVVERVDPDGLRESMTWDDADRLVSRTDRAGHVTRFEYEGDGRDPVLVAYPDGSTVRIGYDDAGLPVSTLDADGVSCRIERNRDGLAVALVDGLGQRTTIEHDRTGRPVAVELPEGIGARSVLDDRGRPIALRTPTGERTFEYTAAGRPLGGRDESGLAWRVELDEAGEVRATETGGRAGVAYERDSIGRIAAVVDAEGARTSFEYDPVGRQVAVVDPLGNRQESVYDAEGRLVEVVDGAGVRRHRELDVLGRPVALVDGGGARRQQTYHRVGVPATVTDERGATWRYEVDEMGRVLAATDPLGATTTYRYTAAGRLAEVRSPLGRTLQRFYDAAGRLARVVEPDGTVAVFERRADGALLRVVRDGVPTTWDYDESGQNTAIAGPWGEVSRAIEGGRVTEQSWVGGGPARFEYGPDGLLARVLDPAGVATDFTRDGCGRLIAAATGPVTGGYRWDAAGRLVSMADSYGQVTSFERDAVGRMAALRYADGEGFVRGFGADGRTTSLDDLDGSPLLRLHRDPSGAIEAAAGPGDTRLTFERDLLGRLTAVGTDVGTVRFGRDADGYLVELGDDQHTVAVDRAIDGRPTGFRLDDGPTIAAPDDLELVRDEHRRVEVDEHGRRFTYDLAGRLASTTLPDGTTTEFGYDDLGLLATERSAAGVVSYGYGRAGELLRRVERDGGVTTYEYDVRGRRTRQVTPDGTVTRYRWNLLGRLEGITRVTADGTETGHTIEHDPYGRPMRIDGTPVLWDNGLGNGLYGLGDDRIVACGNQVRVLTDPDGSWSRMIGDDPWGADGGSGIRVGYRGSLAVDDLLLLGDRAYDTRSRSFLTRDPLPPVTGRLAFAGPYVYAGNDPVNLVDPTGRRPLSDDEYNAWKEANTKGFVRKAAEWVGDNWKTIAKFAVGIAAGVAIAALAATGVGLPLLLLGGAAIGATSSLITSGVIDGKRGWDLAADVGIGALFGAVGGPLARFVPTSTAANGFQRIGTNLGLNAAVEYPSAIANNGLQALVHGTPMDWESAILNGTAATIGGTSYGEWRFQRGGGTSGSGSGAGDGTNDVDTGFGGSGDGPDGGGTPGAGGEPDLQIEPSAPDASPPTSPAPDAPASPGLTQQELKDLPNIGDTLSQRVHDAQVANGGPLTREQLLDIPQIGPARADAILGAYGG